MNTHWEIQLKQKQKALKSRNIVSMIKPFSNEFGIEMNALFANEKAIMYPGKTLSLGKLEVNENKLDVMVSEIPYPTIAMLSDSAADRDFNSETKNQLRPSLAVCTFAITSDNFIVLTLRGEKTNVYPGRYYGQGGNPTQWNFNLTVHQTEEMMDELNISANDVDENSLRFCGIVEDVETFTGKPDLIGWVKLNISSSQLLDKFNLCASEKRPPDVSALRLLHFSKEEMKRFLTEDGIAFQCCPPAHGGLILMCNYFFGGDWIN